MTGPEHYREAEQLLKHARNVEAGGDGERYFLTAAQVHAMLALAAATACGMRGENAEAWDQATGARR